MPGQGMNHEKDDWKMSMQSGLYSQQNYDKFAEEWYDTVLCEAKKWCRNDEAAHLLTKAVLNDCRHLFATKKPPSEPEYYLRAQVCLVYIIEYFFQSIFWTYQISQFYIKSWCALYGVVPERCLQGFHHHGKEFHQTGASSCYLPKNGITKRKYKFTQVASAENIYRHGDGVILYLW